MIRGAIFDLDGTLLNSMDLWAHLGERYLSSLGVDPKENLPIRLQTMSLPEAVHYFQAEYDLKLTEAEILQGIRQLVDHAYRCELKPKPGVLPFLQGLQQHGIPMVVATANDHALAQAVLEQNGLLPFFCGILTCEDAGSSKRTAVIYEKALELLHTPKSKTVVFEDATHAAETAKRAGFLLAGVYDPHERQPEYLQSLSDFYVETYRQPGLLDLFLK